MEITQCVVITIDVHTDIDIIVPMESIYPKTSKAEYAKELGYLLNTGNFTAAIGLVRQALDLYPADLFFCSYLGYLLAVAEKNPGEGIRICEHAITTLRRTMPPDMDFFYPIFYLNIGRAYLSGNKRRAAIEAFREGLKYDRQNREILFELGQLGRRGQPVFPSLKRGNPINKYLGRIRHALQRLGPQ